MSMLCLTTYSIPGQKKTYQKKTEEKQTQQLTFTFYFYVS